ncbi:polymer-forming cytoskeletal protein [Halosimplex rubrum]|uniref:Polymer-forming cytoskeletal protein n=1 Tax=Halosimplex rubrum TaxID=869889 RepID=A0A7D5TAQ6_9EURY|nr:polymer-forming cytoskeletal protein [Halosimplex rubrum]QLH75796.1 polymer-forming cytoskeletal protein [Halosimplex rubrum]
MRRIATVLVVLIVVLSVLPGVAAAATRTGGTVVVGADETVDEDLEAFGGTVVVRGTVNGDLQAFGGSVVVEGTVTGDVEATAGSVQILGAVGGDLTAAGGAVDVGDGAQIDGTLEAGAGSVAVAGTVLGDARIGADSIRLGEGAQIGGDLVYDGDLARADGAVVDGAVTRDEGLNAGGQTDFAIPGAVFTVYGVFVALLVGALLLLVFPGTAAAVADRATGDPLRTGGLGLLTAVAVPVVLAVVAITIVGIPLALAGGLAFGLLVWLGTIYGRFVLGTWLLSLADAENRWAALLVGVLAVAILRLVPVVGALTRLAVFLLGFGALVAVLVDGYRDRRDRRERAPRASDVDDTGAEPAD